eukprot:UN01194
MLFDTEYFTHLLCIYHTHPSSTILHHFNTLQYNLKCFKNQTPPQKDKLGFQRNVYAIINPGIIIILSIYTCMHMYIIKSPIGFIISLFFLFSNFTSMLPFLFQKAPQLTL